MKFVTQRQVYSLLIHRDFDLTNTHSINIPLVFHPDLLWLWQLIIICQPLTVEGHRWTCTQVNNLPLYHLCLLLLQHLSYEQMDVFIIIVTLCSCNLCMKYLNRLLLGSIFIFLLKITLHLSTFSLVVILLLAVCTFTQLWLSISFFPLSPLSFILCLSFLLPKVSNKCGLESWLGFLRLFLHQNMIDDCVGTQFIFRSGE